MSHQSKNNVEYEVLRHSSIYKEIYNSTNLDMVIKENSLIDSISLSGLRLSTLQTVFL